MNTGRPLTGSYSIIIRNIYKTKKSINLPEVLSKLEKLERFYIDQEYINILYNLSPLSALKNLKLVDDVLRWNHTYYPAGNC